MMTGIQIGSSIWIGYLLSVFLTVTAFAVYDILYRQVPDKALAFFIPFAALSPLLKIHFLLDSGGTALGIAPIIIQTVAGALLGFCIPLAAALATGGNGIGGGDIKFCGILGLVYGSSGMALVFLTAAITAMPIILFFKSLYRTKQPLSIPFLPFLACGCCTATLAQLFL